MFSRSMERSDACFFCVYIFFLLRFPFGISLLYITEMLVIVDLFFALLDFFTILKEWHLLPAECNDILHLFNTL